MRAVKQNKSPVINGFQIYYNYIRLYQALEGTPAESANLNLNLQGNKWLELIRKSSK